MNQYVKIVLELSPKIKLVLRLKFRRLIFWKWRIKINTRGIKVNPNNFDDLLEIDLNMKRKIYTLTYKNMII